MDGTILDWVPGPNRTPSWRWRRAQHLVNKHRPMDDRIDDDNVLSAVEFLTAMARASKGKRSRRSAPPDPDIQSALDLWRTASPNQRSKLEAYLLTEEPLEIIAQRCGLRPQLVVVYHELFFSVRPHMHAARDWIALQAIGAYWMCLRGPYPDSLWKLMAYYGGSRVLEMMIAATTGQPFPASLSAELGIHRTDDEILLMEKTKLFAELLQAPTMQEVAAIAERWDRLVAAHNEAIPESGSPRKRSKARATPLSQTTIMAQAMARLTAPHPDTQAPSQEILKESTHGKEATPTRRPAPSPGVTPSTNAGGR